MRHTTDLAPFGRSETHTYSAFNTPWLYHGGLKNKHRSAHCSCHCLDLGGKRMKSNMNSTDSLNAPIPQTKVGQITPFAPSTLYTARFPAFSAM